MDELNSSRLSLRAISVLLAICVVAGCAHRPTINASPDPIAAMQSISPGHRQVYDLVLAHLAREYGRGDTIRVQLTTMAPCDPAATIYYLDCIRERDVQRIESWASGRIAFAGDSTLKQLADSFRSYSHLSQRLLPLESSLFLLRTREQIAAELSAWRGGPPPASIVVARAAFSSDGYAYVYAVFGRERFATGMTFLLQKSGEQWNIVTAVGVWVT